MNSAPVILVNNQQRSTLPVTDRGLAYGDGVFETMLVDKADVTLWQYHYKRLIQGVERLQISIDHSLLYQHLSSSLALLREHQHRTDVHQGVWKLMVTRGEGRRGYMPSSEAAANLITIYTPLTEALYEQNNRLSEQGVSVHYCRETLAISPTLAGIKTLSQLPYVLASQERQNLKAQEGIMFNSAGHLIEATARNVFIVKDGVLITPQLSQSGVAGVMRRAIIEIAQSIDIAVKEIDVSVMVFEQADEVFLSNSISGIWPIVQCGDIHWSVGAITQAIQQHIAKWLEKKYAASESDAFMLSHFLSCHVQQQ